MKTLLPLLLILLFVSCKKYSSENVDQGEIRQTYVVKYFKENNTTEVTASFRYAKGWGGTVQLTGNASIKYGNSPLTFNNFYKDYRIILNGQHIADTFAFTNNNNQIYKNVASFVTPLQFNFSNGIYINKNYEFTLGLGNIIGTTYYNRIKLNFANKTFYATKIGNNYLFTISATQLNDINPGYYVATISNELSNEVQQHTGAGGTISAEYFNNAFSIQVFQ
jgi:hypothetical protein